MHERAELLKFLFLISSKLKINSIIIFFKILEFKTVIDRISINVNPITSKTKRGYSLHTPLENIQNEQQSFYYKFKHQNENEKHKIFKSKLTKIKEYSKCDVCGERLKIGSLSVHCTYYNISGHLDHVNEFIQNNYKLIK